MERLSLFYNGHWVDDIYADEIDLKIQKLGLPIESIDVVSYPEGSKVIPFTIKQDDLTLAQLDKVEGDIINPTEVFEEMKKDPKIKALIDRIKSNNNLLKENSLKALSLNLEEENEQLNIYKIKGQIIPSQPVLYMDKGKKILNFISGEKI